METMDVEFNAALRLLDNGNGAEAYAKFRELAKLGHLEAHVCVGWFHERGRLGSVDETEALKWYETAASQGCATAQYALGNFFKKRNEHVKALEYYYSAAQKGHLASNFNVARSYELGIGAERDLQYAKQIFDYAASQGHTLSQVKVAKDLITTGRLPLMLRGYLLLVKAIVLSAWFGFRNRHDERLLE
jgi:TPR repeat protein